MKVLYTVDKVRHRTLPWAVKCLGTVIAQCPCEAHAQSIADALVADALRRLPLERAAVSEFLRKRLP